MEQKKYFIIDFDSTFVKTETLDELARIVLKNNPQKSEIYTKIKKITNLGMEGKLPFEESLKRRLKLIKGTKENIETVVKVFKRKITQSIKRNKQFFKKYEDSIYIISGGFKECIVPVVKPFYISKEHVLANTFKFDQKNNITGYDKTNLLAQKNGKYKAVQSLHLKGIIYIIGDGYTDYQIKKLGGAKYFFAFTENVKRQSVIDRADHIAQNIDEFLYFNKLPTSISYPKNRIKVLLLENINQEAVKVFEKEGYTVEYYDKSLPDKMLAEKTKNISILGIRSRTIVGQELIKKSKYLISLAAFCKETNQINIKASSQKGIVIFNKTRNKTDEFISRKIIDYINTGNTMFSINFPNIQISTKHNLHRLLHVHRNVPGILAKINGILAKNNINIEGQYLKTNEEIGYVITDVNKKYDKAILKKLKEIEDTIRFRVLY